jgi:hypothetical protein
MLAVTEIGIHREGVKDFLFFICNLAHGACLLIFNIFFTNLATDDDQNERAP